MISCKDYSCYFADLLNHQGHDRELEVSRATLACSCHHSQHSYAVHVLDYEIT